MIATTINSSISEKPRDAFLMLPPIERLRFLSPNHRSPPPGKLYRQERFGVLTTYVLQAQN
jgi:hypothetical protein